MSKKFYRLYCEICNWKLIVDSTQSVDLYEMKSPPIPGGIPKYNETEKEIVVPKEKEMPRKFRCPQCGRVVIPRKVSNPQEKVERHQEAIEAEKRRKEWEKLDLEARRRYEQIRKEYEEEQDEKDRID